MTSCLSAFGNMNYQNRYRSAGNRGLNHEVTLHDGKKLFFWKFYCVFTFCSSFHRLLTLPTWDITPWLHWSQNRHNTTVWTDRLQTRKQISATSLFMSAATLKPKRLECYLPTMDDCLAPTMWVCVEPTVCCIVHGIGVLLHWTKRNC